MWPEYCGIVTVTREWAKDTTLIELENILVNHEALDKKIDNSIKIELFYLF